MTKETTNAAAANAAADDGALNTATEKHGKELEAEQEVAAKRAKTSGDMNIDASQEMKITNFQDDVIVHIASYGSARDMFHFALTCKRFGMDYKDTDVKSHSLMEEAARITLIPRIAVERIEGAGKADFERLKKLVAMKSNEATHQDNVESWLGLYYEFEWCLKAWPHRIVLTDLIDHYKHELKKLKKRPITSLRICGPETVEEFDFDSSSDEWGYVYVPEERVEKVYRTVPDMLYLREVVIDSYESGFSPSRLCSILSGQPRFRTLRLGHLSLTSQTSVEALAVAFESAKLIETLCMMYIWIPNRLVDPVVTIVPLMQAIGRLPRLKRLRLSFDTSRYVNESLQALHGVPGLVHVPSAPSAVKFSVEYGFRYDELRNCSDIDERW